jgi:hypothetical protein
VPSFVSSRGARRLPALIAVLGALSFGLFAFPALAAAATFHVAPAGSGTACSVAAPCELSYALGVAVANDTVQATGGQGTYGTPTTPLTAAIVVPAYVRLEGEPGQPMPTVYTGSHSTFASVETRQGAVLDDFAIHESSTTTALFAGGLGSVERALVFGSPAQAACVLAAGSTIVDSACSGGYGLYESVTGGGQTLPLYVRNDTFYGSIIGAVFSAGDMTFLPEVVNTIFLEGVRVADQTGGTVEVSAINSSYSGVIEEDGATMTPEGTLHNQTAEPLLVDPANGDFRELAGSPTIDAGLASPFNGEFDLAGNAREESSVVTCAGANKAIADIGAYEFVPTVPPCAPPAGGGSGQTGSTGTGGGGGGSLLGAKRGTAGAKILAVHVSGASATLRFKGSGGATRFECRLDHGKWRSCHSPTHFHGLAPGTHKVWVKAVGPSGDQFAAPAKRRFTVAPAN